MEGVDIFQIECLAVQMEQQFCSPVFFLQTSNQHFPLSENHDGNKEKVINLPDNPLHMSPELECVCTMGVSEGTSPYIIWHIHLSAHSKNSLRWWLSQLVFPQLIMNCPSTPRSVLYSGKFNIYGSLRAVGKLPKAPEQKWTAKPTFCASCSPR